MLIWLSFILSLALLLIIARKNLWLGMMVGALVLGIFNLKIGMLLAEIANTLTDISILLLALAVGLIPIIGRALQTSGLLGNLVDNLQISRKGFLAFAPAFLGLLPLPGGALLSAPMLMKAGKDIQDETFVAINVWFRHILILIYPLGAILACSKIVNLNLYTILIYLIPTFLLLSILGYIFLLKNISGKMPSPHKIDYKKLFTPIFIILSAPIIHVTLTNLNMKIMDEISLVIGIMISLILTTIFGKLKIRDFKPIILKMKPWKFFLIIIGVFLFLNVFKTSNVSDEISKIVFSMNFLIVGIAVFLGFVTGRIQLPVSILVPIFNVKFGTDTMTPLIFALMYSAVFIGYMISPVHPCVSFTLEFFETNYKNFFKKLALPGIISLIIIYLAAIILI